MPNQEPAFPTSPRNHGYESSDGTGASSGMTLRDYFAAKSINCSYKILKSKYDRFTLTSVAEQAYDIADAMLVARNKDISNA